MVTSIRTTLKQHTHQSHEHLESLYPLCNMNQSITLSAYQDSLKLLFHWHKGLESCFKDWLATSEYRKYDITAISSELHNELGEITADKHTLQRINRLFKLDISKAIDNSYFLGWLYVILGSSMGASVLHTRLSQFTFYQNIENPFYSKMTNYSQHWLLYLQHLETQQEQDDFSLENLLQGANDGFASLIKIQHLLYGDLN